MKRNFCVHPKELTYNDIVGTSATGISATGIDTNNVNYIVNVQSDMNNRYFHSVKYESIDCALSNSINGDVKMVIFKNNSSTPLANPYPYYVCNSLAISSTRPYITLWLKEDKNPSTYFFTHVQSVYINVYGVFRFGAFFTLNKLENITPFDTFQIGYNTASNVSLPIIGNEDTGTTPNSRNSVSPFNPFFINTYWKNN